MAFNNPQSNNNPHRLLLVSVPRTASNLLLKILNIPNQPNVVTNKKGGYFFDDAFMTAAKDDRLKRPPSEWTAEEKNETKTAFQDGLNELEKYTAQARAENKMMFAKEHAYWFLKPGFLARNPTGTDTTEDLKRFHVSMPESYGPSQTFSTNNQTVLPDEYLRTWQLAFIIRHPALAWPSMYRAMQKLLEAGFIDEDGVKGVSIVNMSMSYTRRLFDWCLEQPDAPITPLVIDANDVIHNPEVTRKFCEKAGLDPAAMQFEWHDAKSQSDGWTADQASSGNAREVERQKKGDAIFLSTLHESTGIVKEKAPASIDIQGEVAKWRVEFGEDVAQLLEKATRNSMPDYEYLKAHRVTV